MLLQTLYDSPPEFLERIITRERLEEGAGYCPPGQGTPNLPHME